MKERQDEQSLEHNPESVYSASSNSEVIFYTFTSDPKICDLFIQTIEKYQCGFIIDIFDRPTNATGNIILDNKRQTLRGILLGAQTNSVFETLNENIENKDEYVLFKRGVSYGELAVLH